MSVDGEVSCPPTRILNCPLSPPRRRIRAGYLRPLPTTVAGDGFGWVIVPAALSTPCRPCVLLTGKGD